MNCNVNMLHTAPGNSPCDAQKRLPTPLSRFKVIPLIMRFIHCKQDVRQGSLPFHSAGQLKASAYRKRTGTVYIKAKAGVDSHQRISCRLVES